MSQTERHLTLTDYQSERQWRWLLQDERGNFLADHDVNLPADPEYDGFRDPADYLHHHSAFRSEADSLARLGAWIGEHVFGKLRPKLAASLTPPATTVHIHVPAAASHILFRPLELAYFASENIADGQSFTAAGLRFIYQMAGETSPARPATKQPAPPTLRLLTVFSLPGQANPLNLRRERYQLSRFVRQLSQTHNAAIELRILQYGATRQTLKEVLEAGDGWDVVHLSGHGLRGALLLEDEKGAEDFISADDLAVLLRPSQQRLKLLILDACYTGGASHAAARRAIGLNDATRAEEQGSGGEEETVSSAALPLRTPAFPPTELPSLAQQLVQKLDCAALAMRYPVGDSFATDLMLALYDKLLDKTQPLPAALQLALADARAADSAHPALSPATPLLFGARAASLRFRLPPRPFGFELPQTGLGLFPAEPLRLVGRVHPLRRASQALAPDSPLRGVLFYGMPGAGKTACALELAYRHERNRFQGQIWYKAPEEGADGQAPDIGQELFNLMFEIERQLNAPQLALTAALDDPQTWRSHTLPRLTGLLGQYSLLLALDNLESLLTSSNRWRDPRWGELVAALLAHNGASRVILTSRRLPADLAAHAAVQREAIHALSFAESVLLARELPQLRTLFASEGGLDLLRRALWLAQGHPKLLELADGLAADPAALIAQLDQAEAAATTDSAALTAFFAPRPEAADEGETRQTERAFVAALGQWTRGVSERLTPAAALLFTFLCRLEAPDRISTIVDANWEDFLKRLAADPSANHPAAPAILALPQLGVPAALTALAQAGLIAVERSVADSQSAEATPDPEALLAILTEQYGDQIASLDPSQLESLIASLQSQISNPPSPTLITIHPGVAEATRAAADPTVLTAVDQELGDYWVAMAQHGLRTETQGGGRLVAESGRRAAPYLLRRERWEDASSLLEDMILRDSSPTTLAFAIPLLRRIVAETEGTERALIDAGVLASALLANGRIAEAEQMSRDVIQACVAQGNYRLASANAGDLLNLLRGDGRLPAALTIAAEKADYSRRAGLGPWTQLADETNRLQVLNAMGQYEAVLARVAELRPQLEALSEQGSLPEQSEVAETVNPWNVREALLDTGHTAALYSEQWAEALAFNADIVGYQEARGADALELARTRFNDYGPLLRLRRFDEARTLLHACRAVYEQEKAIPQLGKVYSALADLEDKVGNRETAVGFEETALRYSYQANNPEDCAISHHNLSNYLERRDAPPALVLAHQLAAALILVSIQSGHVRIVIDNLRKSDLPPTPPSFAAVAAQVAQIAGVQFQALFARLPQTFPSGDAAITAVWQLVQQEKANQEQSATERMAQLLEEWEPLLQAIAAVAQGEPGENGREEIETLLPQLAENGWQISEAVQHIWSGERDAAILTTNLDGQDAALINRILAILSSSG